MRSGSRGMPPRQHFGSPEGSFDRWMGSPGQPSQGRTSVPAQEPGRDASVSPGKESVHTMGDDERMVLNSVIARLQHGIELAGDPAASYPGRWHETTNLEKLRGRLSGPREVTSHNDGSMRELRMQLDRAGIVIAQQLETSSRKDVLMEEQEARCKMEKINAQMQLERIYDVLTEERAERCATEETLMEQLNGAHGEKEMLLNRGEMINTEGKEALDATIGEYEDRMGTMAEQHKEALEEALKKQDDIRREAREEIQEAAARQSETMAEAESKRREEKETSESMSDLLLLQIEELEQRIEVYEETDLVLFGCAVDAGESAVEKMGEEGATRNGERSTELQEMRDEHTAELEAETLRHQEELKDVTERLEEALRKEQACSEEYRRLLDEATSEHERERTELESDLRGGLPDLNRMASRTDNYNLEELIMTQQDAGRYQIMLSQLQELMAFMLTRYAPQLMGSGEDEFDPIALHPGTKHTSVFPSYWGWMFRSSGMFVSWQRRFFVLRDGVLKYSTNDQGPFQNIINVESIAKVELESFKDATQGNHPPTGKYESFGFMIETYSRQRMRFCCTSSSERAEWMNVFRKCIEIRLNIERAKAYSPDSEQAPEPYLYLEDCSPPDAPPTYRTRVRLADTGAYPMLGPGSPPRSKLPQPMPAMMRTPPPTERPPVSPKYGNPPRPLMMTTGGSGSKGGTTMGPIRVGPGQQGGASGIGSGHINKTPKKKPTRPATVSSVKKTSGMHQPPPQREGSITSSKRRSSKVGPGSAATSETGVADGFEGTVPLDVLLVKVPSMGDEDATGLEEEEVRITRACAHAFDAKFKQSYDKTQLFHAWGSVATDTSAIYHEVLDTDAPTLFQGISNSDPSVVLKLLGNMAAQPAVSGAPSSLLCILVGPDECMDELAASFEASYGDDCPDPVLPEYGAALFSSLYAAHRNSVSWTFITRVDASPEHIDDEY